MRTLRRAASVLAVVLVAGPGAAAGPSGGAVRVEGSLTGGQVTVQRVPGGVRIATRGLAGQGVVECLDAACEERGFDGTTASLRRDILLAVDEAVLEVIPERRARVLGVGQAGVRGRTAGTAVFADGFESGDVSRVRGFATCMPGAGSTRCTFVLDLQGRTSGGSGGQVAGRLEGVLVRTRSSVVWETLNSDINAIE